MGLSQSCTASCTKNDGSGAGGFNEKTVVLKFKLFEDKMRAEKLPESAIAAFKNAYFALASGSSGTIAEAAIDPATGVQQLEPDSAASGDSVREQTTAKPELLKQTVMLKLNGGLGTSMGLDKAKSLLPVKDGLSFLDLIAKPIEHTSSVSGDVRFMLMNSFSTSADTNAAFKQVGNRAVRFCCLTNLCAFCTVF